MPKVNTGTITASRKIHFCTGHILKGHEGKCANLHGHNYNLYAEAQPFVKLDGIGRVVDFSVIKDKLGKWIDDNWDHNFIVFEKHEEAVAALKLVPQDKKLFLFPYNPTAENMCKYLMENVIPTLGFDLMGVDIVSLTLWETENCYVEYKK